jgi:hypothetical protein
MYFMKMLSQHFSLHEFVRSDTADRLGISNDPLIQHIENMERLARNILEPLREKLGRPIFITSGYRSPSLNAEIPGSSATSDHTVGRAADIKVPGLTPYDVCRAAYEMVLDYDQLILEFWTPTQPFAGWTHVSHRDSVNRHSSYATKRVDGNIAMVPWIPDERL